MLRAFAAIALVLFVNPAWAEDHPRDPSQIVLQLVEEAWVETKSARVIVQLKTLLTGDKAAEPVVDPKSLFAPVAAAEWQMTSFQRGQTDTGFEQWVIVAEARLPQSALTGIYDRVKQASSRGQTVSVRKIDFTPSLAERQATAALLRAALYARAAAEAERVAAVFPDRGFQMHRVDFNNGGVPQPVMMRRQVRDERAYAVQAKQGGYAPSVAERLILQATVVVAADGNGDD
jgi:hypothetical protein